VNLPAPPRRTFVPFAFDVIRERRARLDVVLVFLARRGTSGCVKPELLPLVSRS